MGYFKLHTTYGYDDLCSAYISYMPTKILNNAFNIHHCIQD
jgi:hypothetical protein